MLLPVLEARVKPLLTALRVLHPAMNEYHIFKYLVTPWKTEVEAEVHILISETAFFFCGAASQKIWLYFKLSKTDFAFFTS